jgi:hypothetical protein
MAKAKKLTTEPKPTPAPASPTGRTVSEAEKHERRKLHDVISLVAYEVIADVEKAACFEDVSSSVDLLVTMVNLALEKFPPDHTNRNFSPTYHPRYIG